MSEELKEKEENKIITGLKQAVEFAKGDASLRKVTHHNVKELLKKSSHDIKRERKIETVSFDEILGVILGIPNSDTIFNF